MNTPKKYNEYLAVGEMVNGSWDVKKAEPTARGYVMIQDKVAEESNKGFYARGFGKIYILAENAENELKGKLHPEVERLAKDVEAKDKKIQELEAKLKKNK